MGTRPQSADRLMRGSRSGVASMRRARATLFSFCRPKAAMPTMTDVRREHAKIVEILDAKGASFVSVTQQFNTTTSMGRLTLNVLLSFAQFEGVGSGERLRDKIAASKQKGMWRGGMPPLGYQAQN